MTYEPGDSRRVAGVTYVYLIDYDGRAKWFGPGWQEAEL